MICTITAIVFIVVVVLQALVLALMAGRIRALAAGMAERQIGRGRK